MEKREHFWRKKFKFIYFSPIGLAVGLAIRNIYMNVLFYYIDRGRENSGFYCTEGGYKSCILCIEGGGENSFTRSLKNDWKYGSRTSLVVWFDIIWNGSVYTAKFLFFLFIDAIKTKLESNSGFSIIPFYGSYCIIKRW